MNRQRRAIVGSMRFRRPRKISAGRGLRVSGRLLGVTSAVVLATGLLSAIPVAAGAKRAAPHAPVPSLRSASPDCGRRSRRRRAYAGPAGRLAGRRFCRGRSTSRLATASIVNTYKVTTTADTTPASCPATTAEPCTLRQAVMQANADGTLDKIQVPAAASPVSPGDRPAQRHRLGRDWLSPAPVRPRPWSQADTTSTAYPFRVLQIKQRLKRADIQRHDQRRPLEHIVDSSRGRLRRRRRGSLGSADHAQLDGHGEHRRQRRQAESTSRG